MPKPTLTPIQRIYGAWEVVMASHQHPGPSCRICAAYEVQKEALRELRAAERPPAPDPLQPAEGYDLRSILCWWGVGVVHFDAKAEIIENEQEWLDLMKASRQSLLDHRAKKLAAEPVPA